MKQVDWLKIAGRPLTVLLFVAGAVLTVVDLWDRLGGWKWIVAGIAVIYLVAYVVWEVRRRRYPAKWLKRFTAASELAEGDVSDGWFQWSLARRVLTVERPNARYEQLEEGVNTLGRPVDHIIRTVAADAPTEFDSIGFKAWYQIDNDPEKEAYVEPTQSHGTKFRCTISFPARVVPPTARLRTRREFVWPAAVALKQEYWLLPMHYPAARLQVEFRFRDTPRDISFWNCPKNEVTPVPLALQGPADANGWKVYTADVEGKPGWYGVEWKLP